MFAKLTVLALSALAACAAPTALEARSFSGDGTYYDPGLGACGKVNVDADMIVAVSHLLYDSYPGATPNPNLNPICGRALRATYNNRTVDVTVQDKCMGCQGMYDLDFTLPGISKLVDDPVFVGRLHGVTWDWL
ncbi:hypothetical protein CYLTODRAFT_457812 [Cylindrobasidium torrendii FP15055 ss-10]|uniref:RlpA-like protein double-psi beta-barrel domain-containing protein n=1 Tax=Cylindrobasidium torrendii FP15055 ss-10 TaxID=1314674 RepID=A0A0D7B0X0_9AGAR|nr:hypothetical protein CYLTODRAFT_457812 [Cylindrobasidium torrendii FP15055 ss-10]